MTTAMSPIREFMTPAPVSIGRAQPMAEASRRMREHRIRHLPVLEGGRVVGIVSDRDISMVESLPGVDPGVVRVEEAMTAEPYAISPTTPLVEVVEAMAAHKIGTAVVMEGERLIGIVSVVDVLRAFAAALRG